MIKDGILKFLKMKNLMNFNNIAKNNKKLYLKINAVFIIKLN